MSTHVDARRVAPSSLHQRRRGLLGLGGSTGQSSEKETLVPKKCPKPDWFEWVSRLMNVDFAVYGT